VVVVVVMTTTTTVIKFVHEMREGNKGQRGIFEIIDGTQQKHTFKVSPMCHLELSHIFIAL
jgi:hypothetical protein